MEAGSNGQLGNPKAVDREVIAATIRPVLELVCRHLVDHPNDVHVTTEIGERTVRFVVVCKKTDVGQVLGKRGINIDAIRDLLFAMSSKHGIRAVIELDEVLDKKEL